MATKTQQPSRFSRLGLNLKLPSVKTKERETEDWYIPYNGPYEIPQDAHQAGDRDSWGNLIHRTLQGEQADPVIGDNDLFDRYGSDHEASTSSRKRNRVLSNASSGSLDPARKSLAGTSRTRFSTYSGPRPPVPSFINLDAAGGIGESPVSHQRAPYPTRRGEDGARASFSSLFTFGGSKKPERSDPLQSNASTDAPRRRDRSKLAERHPGREEEDYYDSYYSTLLVSPTTAKPRPSVNTTDTISQGKSPSERQSHPGSPTSLTSFSSPPATPHQASHPYAYVSPPAVSPNSAPAEPTPRNLPAVTLTVPPVNGHHSPGKTNGGRGFLKSSVSTPNLRGGQPQKKTSASNGVERWLSAETWLDALLFPRPRFKVKQFFNGRTDSPLPSPDIVDPPREKFRLGWSQRKQPPANSRGLMKSRSLVDLLSSSGSGLSKPAPPVPPRESPSLNKSARPRPRGLTLPHIPPSLSVVKEGGTPPETDKTLLGRPKSFALDDLALPSPVPSLARVLEEGEELNKQRKEWQKQASRSFQNKRTRSFSRSRAKSLVGHQKDKDSKAMTNIDFLAERTFLGSQGISPTIHVTSPSRNSPHSGNGTNTFSSHSNSHSHSHSHTRSHSHSHSNSHSNTHSHSLSLSSSQKSTKQRSHSRNASWGKSAFRMVKSTASLCGLNADNSFPSPLDEKGAALENALKSDQTKVIRLGLEEKRDGVSPVIFSTTSSPRSDIRGEPGSAPGSGDARAPSPVPSSTEGIGIAISTPPPLEGHTREPYDPESLKLPDHPYAQGAALPYHSDPDTPIAGRHRSHSMTYAGPHPSAPVLTLLLASAVNDVSTRHRFPPQATRHPYAPYYAEDETSQGSSPIRMLPPTDVRDHFEEIQPVSYSVPPVPDSYHSHAYATAVEYQKRNTALGIDEALGYAFASKGSRDSGIGTSEDTSREIQAQNELAVENTTSVPQLRQPNGQFEMDRGISQVSGPPSYHTRASHQAAPPSPREASVPYALRPSYATPSLSSVASSSAPSSGSSPQIMPRPLDDLERFRGLFYQPDTPPRPPSEPWPANFSPQSNRSVEVPLNISSQSVRGLSTVVRQLSAELEDFNGQIRPSPGMVSRVSVLSEQHFGGVQSQSTEPFLTEAARSDSPEASLPVHLHTMRGDMSTLQPSENIPEDVESSRASSLFESSLVEDDTFGVLRLGVVEAVSTPPATTGYQRQSSHLYLLEDGNRHHANERASDPGTLSSPISLQLPSADPTRSSYVASDTSRMSGLSDFPAPPHVSPAHMTLIQSYFDHIPREQNTTLFQQVTARPQPERRDPSYRMTFGGDEDVEFIPPSSSSRF